MIIEVVRMLSTRKTTVLGKYLMEHWSLLTEENIRYRLQLNVDYQIQLERHLYVFATTLTCVITLTAVIGNNFSLLLEFFYCVYLTVLYYRLWEGDVGIHVNSD